MIEPSVSKWKNRKSGNIRQQLKKDHILKCPAVENSFNNAEVEDNMKKTVGKENKPNFKEIC